MPPKKVKTIQKQLLLLLINTIDKPFLNVPYSKTTFVTVNRGSAICFEAKQTNSKTTFVTVNPGIKNNEAENFLEFKNNFCYC